MQYQESSTQTSTSLEFTQMAAAHLAEAGRWARFIAILGFIGIGIMVFTAVFFLFFSAVTEAYGRGLSIALTLLYLLMAVLYYFPVKYLYDFSRSATLAVSSGQITAAMDSLRKHYRFVGILTLVSIGLYFVLLIVSFFIASAGGFSGLE